MHKQTEGKLRLDLVPPHALKAMAEIREFGQTKYPDPWEWVHEVLVEDLITACDRHLLELKYIHSKGYRESDKESGLPHIWHALTSLAMAVEIIECKEEKERCLTLKRR